MKLPVRKGNVFVPVLMAVILVITGVLIFKATPKSQTRTTPTETTSQAVTSDENLKTYTSKDLKISFSYPGSWQVSEKDFDIMITSYKTRIGENKEPSNNEMRIFINNYSRCLPNLEEDLINPACGEGGKKSKNQIISKDTRSTSSGTFFKYVIKVSDNNNYTFYFLQKGERILDIEKTPDPSQFETEFNQIVDSIRFLP